MTNPEANVVAAWKEAAADLGIVFTAPFVTGAVDGSSQVYLGIVHQFGCHRGVLISVLNEPSADTPRPAEGEYYWSTLGPKYERYSRQEFIDTLNDWQFFGPAAERPSWYSGDSWS